jgi:hypothetical protein
MLKWSAFKTILQRKLRYHGNSVISPGTTASDIAYDTPFDIQARIYYEQWFVDVYARPVDKSAFMGMDITKRTQNLYTMLAEPVFEAHKVWIDGGEITQYPNYRVLERTFDAVNTASGQPGAWARVRPYTIMFHCVPAAFYSSSYVQGYGIQKVTSDEELLEAPSHTLDTLSEYVAAHFMSGTVDSRPGLDLLKMFNAKAYTGALAVRGENLSYDFTGSQRGG